MAPIKLKEIIKTSSQDNKFPAKNLLQGQKWMNDAEDKSVEASIEIALDAPSQIHYVDIGYFNVSSMKVQVSSSSRASCIEPLTLLDTVLLQNPMDARAGRNKSGCKMFNFNEHLDREVAKLSWNKVKITLWQPYARNKHMGLEFLRLGTPRNVTLTERSSTNQAVASPHRLSHDQLRSDSKLSASSPSSRFEAKLRNMSSTPESSTSNCLGRTAKMLMSSKRMSLQATSVDQDKASTSTSDNQRHGKVESQGQSSEVYELSNSTFGEDDDIPILKKNNKRRSPFITEKQESKCARSPSKNSDNPSLLLPQAQHNSKNISPKANEKAKQQTKLVTAVTKATKPMQTLSKNWKAPIVEVIEETVSNSLKPKNVSKLGASGDNSSSSQPTTSESLRRCDPACQNTDSLGSQTELSKQEDDIVQFVQETQEVTYTDKQVRQLKKAIKRFFNTLNMDSIDLNTMKVKDLRKQFESSHNVKLNKDGRSYFRDMTGRFMSIVSSAQQRQDSQDTSVGIKRKSNIKEKSSPAKIPRQTIDEQPACSSHNAPDSMVQCPICFEYFESSAIGGHAALCGQDDDDGLPAINISSPRPFQHADENFASGNVVDTSHNSCLTQEEQNNWINYSKEPKPYQERLNRSDYEGCMLVKCPICGQKYKESEIEIHSDDCAEKVHSGCTRMGLYLLDPKKAKKNQTNTSRNVAATSSYLLD